MTARDEEAPVELSGKQSFVVGCGIGVVVLLLVGLVVVWQGKKAEDEKRSRTTFNLSVLATSQLPLGVPADGSGADWTGQFALGRSELLLDGWGNPIRYRCPGPVHKKGWDLWSCGPNGKDDQGSFDDILVGEDVAPTTSR